MIVFIINIIKDIFIPNNPSLIREKRNRTFNGYTNIFNT